MRSVDLAIYADTLAAEAATVAARLERARSRVRQAAIERAARDALAPGAVAHLESLGLLTTRTDRDEIRELAESLDALEQLQTWIEARLATAE